jgi:hypothetical protein
MVGRAAAASDAVPVVAPPDPPPARGPQALPANPAPPTTAEAARARAEAEYAHRYVWVHGPLLQIGEAHVPLSTPAFYETIGRGDLIEAEQARATVRRVLIAGGISGAVIGVGWGLLDLAVTAFVYPIEVGACYLSRDPMREQGERCEDQLGPSSTPWILALVGGAVAVGGGVMSTDATTPAERARLAHEYNTRLYQRLFPEAPRAAARAAPLSLRVSGVITPAGGLLALRGRF